MREEQSREQETNNRNNVSNSRSLPFVRDCVTSALINTQCSKLQITVRINEGIMYYHALDNMFRKILIYILFSVIPITIFDFVF